MNKMRETKPKIGASNEELQKHGANHFKFVDGGKEPEYSSLEELKEFEEMVFWLAGRMSSICRRRFFTLFNDALSRVTAPMRFSSVMPNTSNPFNSFIFSLMLVLNIARHGSTRGAFFHCKNSI